MKIVFPQPVHKKTVEITMKEKFYQDVETIMQEKGITEEQVISTFLDVGWSLWLEQQQVIHDFQESRIIETVTRKEEPVKKKPGPKSSFTPEEKKARQKKYAKNWYLKKKQKEQFIMITRTP